MFVHLCLHQIPPTAVGGSLRFNLPSLHPSSTNPTDGSRWIVKVQPASPPSSWTLTIPQLPLGGLQKGFATVGRILTIPQLPLGGFHRIYKHLLTEAQPRRIRRSHRLVVELVLVVRLEVVAVRRNKRHDKQ